MLKFTSVAGTAGRGSRILALFLGLFPMAGLLAACGGGGGSGGGDDGGQFIVLAVTPTNSQETLEDMSDPELDGKLTIKFSSAPTKESILDPTNSVNGCTPYVQILNQAFARVQGQPSLDRQGRQFTFTPNGGKLDKAQYTVTLSKFVKTGAGSLLNAGLEDFSASWTVGPDSYNPVVRNTTPASNQNDAPLFNPIVITFNESLDSSSVVLGQTVFVQDGGTNPPTQLSGTLGLRRNGFDLVFVPDPCVGLPPSTTVVVRMLGAGNTTFIRDLVGNPLVGDPANNNELVLQFNTKGVKPLPDPAATPGTWSPLVNPFSLFNCVVYAVTSRATYAFDCTDVILGVFTSATFDPTLVQQVLEGGQATARWDAALQAFVLNPPPYRGTWEAKLEQPGEAVIDIRFDGTTGHSYIYQIDEAAESVAIINTGNGKIEGRFKGVGSPKGITRTGGSSQTFALQVTNFGQGTLTRIPLNTIVAGQPICTAVQELNDNPALRDFMSTGRNPSGVAAEIYGAPIAVIVNSGDDTIQVYEPYNLAPLNNGIGNIQNPLNVGENSVDVAMTPYNPLSNFVWAYVVSQGGPNDPEGAVSLFWNYNSLGIGAFASNTGGIAGIYTDGLKSPGRPLADPFTLEGYIPNTAGNSVHTLNVVLTGASYARTVTIAKSGEREVGPNPTRLSFAGRFGSELAFVSLAGEGQVAAFPLNSTVGPPVLLPMPGVRSLFCSLDN
jgi:hypothetical protein